MPEPAAGTVLKFAAVDLSNNVSDPADRHRLRQHDAPTPVPSGHEP